MYETSRKWLRFRSSLAVFQAFFGLWVGGVETITGSVLVLVKPQVYEQLRFLSASCGGNAVHIHLLRMRAVTCFHPNMKTFPFFLEEPPFGSLYFEIEEVLLFTCLKRRSQGFIYPLNSSHPFRCDTKIRSAFSRRRLVCWALIAFESDATGLFPLCAPRCEPVPRCLWQPQCETDVSEGRHVCSPATLCLQSLPAKSHAHCIRDNMVYCSLFPEGKATGRQVTPRLKLGCQSCSPSCP